MHNNVSRKHLMRRQTGFTIVELLIVIVVIGILAAIVIVAYSGVQNRANDAAVIADLKSNAKKLQVYFVDHNAYPSDNGSGWGVLTPALTEAKMQFTQGSYMVVSGQGNAAYYNNNNGQDFVLMSKSKSGKVFYYGSKIGTVEEYTDSAHPFSAYSSTIKTSLGMNMALSAWALDGTGTWATWAQ